jgi:hypothetical protein
MDLRYMGGSLMYVDLQKPCTNANRHPRHRFYIPKIPYLCIHGIGLSTYTIFQTTAEELFLKNYFLDHVRALLHYYPHT